MLVNALERIRKGFLQDAHQDLQGFFPGEDRVRCRAAADEFQ